MGNTDSIQTTVGKQLRVRLQRDFRFPRGFNSKAEAEGRRRRQDARGGRSRGRSRTPRLGAAMADAFIRHIELLGYEKRFFPSQHYVSTQ